MIPTFQEAAPEAASPFLDFAIALFIGALVGIEREKVKRESGEPEIGGLRTFILFAEAGAIAAWISRQTQSPWIFIAVGLSIAAIIVAGYAIHTRAAPQSIGITTEVAGIVVYLLGGAALFGYRELAVALAIATSAVLAYKQPLHVIVGKLGETDLKAGLRLLIATFIVLPVLPDRAIDPWGALNPYKIWWLVILISGLSFLGYGISRWIGPGRGAALTGFVGGLVSSTAVTLSFAKQSRERETGQSPEALSAGVLFAWAVMFVRIPVLAVVLFPQLWTGLAAPAVVGCLGCLGLGLAHLRRGLKIEKPRRSGDVPLKNPFSLSSAAKFAALFAGVLLLVKVASPHVPESGLYGIAALGGLADPDAIALSMGTFARDGGASRTAVVAIVIAMLANNGAKAALAITLGSAAFRVRILVAMLAIAAAVAAATFVFPGPMPGSA